jgi:DGQHR domain-containing protein
MTAEVKLPAIEVEQSPGKRLYTFCVEGKDLSRFAAVSRVRRNDEEKVLGYQRPEVSSHIAEIRRYIESDGPTIPNALVLAFDERVSFEALNGESVESGRFGWLKVPFDDENMPGWIVDGQQRAAAIREADIDRFPVFVIAFIAASEEEQAEQFILVNSTKPLPKSLLFELIPNTSTRLPSNLHARRLDAILCDRLNHADGSVFFGRIKTATNPDGKINQTAVMNMIRNSRTDGLLYRFGGGGGEEPDIDAMQDVVQDFWAAVAEVFVEAWERDPRKSRLTHGAGIIGMGYIMDAIGDRLRKEGIPDTEEFAKDLWDLEPACRWTDGSWEFGPGLVRRWNEIQNTPKDVQMLANYLLAQYRTLVWDPKVVTRKSRARRAKARA